MTDRSHPLPMTRQAAILALSRSSLYYEPGSASDDLALMAAIDEIHLELPFYGARRIRDELRRPGICRGPRHTSTLMGRMGMEALFPKRKLSKPAPGHKIYPYLLRDKDITRGRGGLVRRCHLPAHGPRFLLPGRDHGLGQPAGPFLPGVEHP